MAFFYEPHDPSLTKPRDASAIHRRAKYDAAGNIVSLVTLLLLIAVTYGLYLLYVGSAPTQTAVMPPPVEQLSPAAPTPATQPPTQTPTP